MDDAERQSQISIYRETVVAPLLEEERYNDLCERILEMLDAETDLELRFELVSDLAMSYDLAGDREDAQRWVETLTREFPDDYRSWANYAGWYFYSPHPGRPTTEDLIEALTHFETALEKARQSNEFVRVVLFDICRVLTAMEDFQRLASYMTVILEDLETPRANDIPRFEADWLKRIPDGAIDHDLRRVFEDLRAADEVRVGTLGYAARPPTRQELNAYG